MSPQPAVSPQPTDRTPRVVLGVSGGIAAYKAVEVCRRLVDSGCHVAPVLTEGALRFVGRTTFDALGSERAWTSLFDEDRPIPHTHLGQTADLVIVAAGSDAASQQLVSSPIFELATADSVVWTTDMTVAMALRSPTVLATPWVADQLQTELEEVAARRAP